MYGGERRRSVERFGARVPLNELVFVGVFVESLFEGRRKAAVSRAFLESLSLNGLGLVGVLAICVLRAAKRFGRPSVLSKDCR